MTRRGDESRTNSHDCGSYMIFLGKLLTLLISDSRKIIDDARSLQGSIFDWKIFSTTSHHVINSFLYQFFNMRLIIFQLFWRSPLQRVSP